MRAMIQIIFCSLLAVILSPPKDDRLILCHTSTSVSWRISV